MCALLADLERVAGAGRAVDAEAVGDAPRIGGEFHRQGRAGRRRRARGTSACSASSGWVSSSILASTRVGGGDAFAEIVVVEQVGEHGGVGGDGPDFGFAQRFAERIERVVARGPVGDGLGDHAVIGGGDGVALFHRAVEAEGDAGRWIRRRRRRGRRFRGGRSWAGSRARDLRRTGALRRRGR